MVSSDPESSITQSKMVLVVEDDETLRNLTGIQLRRLGYTWAAAGNGEEALNLVTQTEYILILMDIQMPCMDGCEAAVAIRDFEKKNTRVRSPIVAMTASPNRQRCMDAGMDDFLFKPFLMTQLKEALKRWVPKAS